ncbi:rho GTPase-activating protein 11A [Hemicordylus capensis]|uniref:rho GTPase-activating protein 11A n=1 Tax=Hemicordylus capensis TaxID=884348 RepID=UPI0023031C12|nr:rho GTPase-activating protein 11A [Hemicordylus capensis]XP_053128015.1 rho GTPase-activating protein 11A [Hemicordylus capensis]XP_053128026.1 rho GTPase-activating protein 11A [Hemicordylus capensis]
MLYEGNRAASYEGRSVKGDQEAAAAAAAAVGMASVRGRERGLAQLAVLQQLRAAYGIKMKSRAAKGKSVGSASVAAGGNKVFGIALHALPHQVVPEYGSIPCFLVDACKYLEEHIHTEGLFRKSGSFIRIKTLKSKLDQGENCLSTAQPCDVAGLLKQFFRELPEPIFPADLQEALIKAQQLGSDDKNSATLLLSCLMNDGTIDTLRYFFSFLKKVSLRSFENKMDSNNLAVIFAPNLLQSSEADKISAHTEKKLRLQAAVLQVLIDHAEDIGHVPKFILEKIPTMLGIDDPVSTPSLQDYEESENPGEHQRRRRQSVGVFASVTPVIVTPSIKRKYPPDSCQGFSSKKRLSIRHNLALELLPSSLFSFSSTPGSAQLETSPCISFEASQSSPSTSVTHEKFNIGIRRSKRIASKKVHRVESGKMGCFSPKISRKEMVRKSLRLKFILGKNSRENTAVEHPASNRSGNIGRRLASQHDTESGVDTPNTVALLSPCVAESITKKGSKKISKSEENLQTANCYNEASYRMSWTACTTESQETCNSGTNSVACLEENKIFLKTSLAPQNPAVIPARSRSIDASPEQNSNNRQTSFCEAENHVTADTLLKIKRAFSESGSNLHNLLETEPSKSNPIQETACISRLDLRTQVFKATAQNMKNVEQETLFANSSATDKHLLDTNEISAVEGPLFPNTTDLAHELSKSDASVQEDQLTGMISPDTPVNNGSNLQKELLESHQQFIPERIFEDKELKYCNSEKETKELTETMLPEDGDRNSKQHLHMKTHEKSKRSPSGKVADHIHWFNNLSLNEPCSATKTKQPLKFQRTPVRQSIRRMNSILEAKSVSCNLIKPDGCFSLVKSVSYETALSCAENVLNISTTSLSISEPSSKQMFTDDQFTLSSKSCPQLICPLEQAARPGTTCKEKSTTTTTTNQSKSVLEDLTNHEAPKTTVKMNTNLNVSIATTDKCILRKAEKGTRYRGSPKNPIATVKLLPTTRPLDL